MRIDVVLVSLLCIMIGSTVIARAQQSRVSRVLIIMAEKPYYAPPQITGLRDRLNELGYIEGRNVIYDLLQEENDDALRASFRTFVQKNVDVIVAVGQVEAAIASELTGKIPIVFMPAGDPVGTKLVRFTGNSRNEPDGSDVYGTESHCQASRSLQRVYSFSKTSRPVDR